MYTELQLAVKNNDWEYIKKFLSTGEQSKLRRCGYAACLFDNVEVAQYCYEHSRDFEKATVAVALQQGATKVADFLYEWATQNGHTNILDRCDFVITDSFAERKNRFIGASWLLQRGYKFKYHEILGLIVYDDLELFKFVFRPTFQNDYDMDTIVQKCLYYKAYKILQFLQTKFQLSVENPEYSEWKKLIALEA